MKIKSNKFTSNYFNENASSKETIGEKTNFEKEMDLTAAILESPEEEDLYDGFSNNITFEIKQGKQKKGGRKRKVSLN